MFPSPKELMKEPKETIIHELKYRKEILFDHHIDIDKFIGYSTILYSSKGLPNQYHGTTNTYFCTSDINRDPDTVLKIITATCPDVAYEFYIQKEFYKCGKKAPIIVDENYFKRDHKFTSVVMMDIMTLGPLGRYLVDKLSKKELDQVLGWIFEIFRYLKKNKLTHGDLHWGNIFFTEDKKRKPIPRKPILIDFGNATKGVSHIQIEVLQLLRTLNMFGMNKDNKKYLEEKLLDFYHDNFGDLKKGQKYYENMHDVIFYGYYIPEVLNPAKKKFLKTFKKYQRLDIKDPKKYWPKEYDTLKIPRQSHIKKTK